MMTLSLTPAGLVINDQPIALPVHTISAIFEESHELAFRPKSSFCGTIAWEAERFGPQETARLIAHLRKEATRQKVKVKTT